MIIGMDVPMEYHLLFLVTSFMVFILIILLLFIDTTFEKTVGAFILCAFNLIINLIVAFVFSAVDIYGYTASGELVHNVYGGMYPLSVVAMGLMWLCVMLMVYCVYLFINKPWIEVMGDEFTQGKYSGPPY
jgi:hypothetical protein